MDETYLGKLCVREVRSPRSLAFTQSYTPIPSVQAATQRTWPATKHDEYEYVTVNQLITAREYSDLMSGSRDVGLGTRKG